MQLQAAIPIHNRPITIAGPCSAETEAQLTKTCLALAASNKVDVLRAGIWKPRTRPGNFEGIGSQGLAWFQHIKQQTQLPIMVEVANAKHVYEALRYGVDLLWIGARTTANPFSVQEIADALRGVDIPVLVKNPINPDLGLWIGALERMYNSGITRLAALHRGFSKYGASTYRNLPQWEIPIELKRQLPNIQLICDPSHIAGNSELVPEIAQYACDLHFDGLMIETHHNPQEAWSDAKQQLSPNQLIELLDTLIIPDASVSQQQQSTLDCLRQNINDIDHTLIELLASRMEVSKQIGAFKRSNQLTILQQQRWHNILETRIQKGKNLGLSEVFLTKYLEAVHQESIDQQR